MAIVKVNVNVGELNTASEIQRFEQIFDEYGFSTPKWTTIAKPRCKVSFDDRLIRNMAKDDGVDTSVVKLFDMRYIPNITTKDRIVCKGKLYEIYSVQNINEQNRFMRLWGRELDPTT